MTFSYKCATKKGLMACPKLMLLVLLVLLVLRPVLLELPMAMEY
jgi:hypothetical protein